MKKLTLVRLCAFLMAALLLVACRDAAEDVVTDMTTALSSILQSSGSTAPATTDTDPTVTPTHGHWQWDPHVFDLLNGEHQSSAEKLADAILAYESTVTLGSDAQIVADNFAYEFPPAALVDLTVQEGNVKISYLYNKQTHEEKLTAFENAVEYALNSSLEPEDSEIERALLLYRYVVSNVRYFTVDYTEKETTAFSALTEGVTICYGFADAFGYLLRQTGMEAHMYRGARSDGAEHGWTYAKVDGKFYHFDPTWETSNLKTGGILGLSYFGMNDERRYRGMMKESVCGFGELTSEGETDSTSDWLLPNDLYPYNEWSYDRETGVISCKKGSLKLSES